MPKLKVLRTTLTFHVTLRDDIKVSHKGCLVYNQNCGWDI